MSEFDPTAATACRHLPSDKVRESFGVSDASASFIRGALSPGIRLKNTYYRMISRPFAHFRSRALSDDGPGQERLRLLTRCRLFPMRLSEFVPLCVGLSDGLFVRAAKHTVVISHGETTGQAYC